MGFWDASKPLGPSAGLVQQHYLQARIDELRRRDKNLERQVQEALARLVPAAKSKNWLETYLQIQRRVQDSDLTINFEADAWFSSENHYPSYMQVYDRDQDAHGRKVLIDKTNDPAHTRARVDDAATIPQAWNTPAPAAGAPARPGALPATRVGLMPGLQSGQRIAAQMAFGPQSATTDKRLFSDTFGKRGVKSGNGRFNPKTKQVFAAVNYGRRPNGSTTRYGDSHLVLSPKFKAQALYFAADTFYTQAQNISIQLPYGLLGAVIAQNHDNWRGQKDVIESCYNNKWLANTNSEYHLLEAHIFSELPFTGNLVSIVLAAKRGTVVYDNARKFAAKHGAQLVLV